MSLFPTSTLSVRAFVYLLCGFLCLGPEPPKDIVFSEVTENSLTVSWTKPKSPISGFKVTYTHKEEGKG